MSTQRGRGQGRGRGGDPSFRGGGPGFGGGHRGGGRGGGPPGAGRGRGGGPPSGPLLYRENTPAQIPSSLSPQSLNQLITKLQSLKVGPERPLRPGFGTLGRATAVRANFFAVKISKPYIYDYAVIIKPDEKINRLKMRIFDLLEATPAFKPYIPFVAHDRSQRLVSEKKLPQPLVFKVPFYEDNEQGPTPKSTVYELSCQYVATHATADLNKYKDGDPSMRDFDTQPITSAVNLITQQYARRNGGIRVGENRFFFPQGPARPLGVGVQAWEGFYTSFRIVQGTLALNVNVCMTAFLEPGNVADRLLAFSHGTSGGLPSLPPSMVNALKVRTKHLGYRKKLQAIGTVSARKKTFDCQEYGGKISVEEYFKRKYRITLKYADTLPVVNVGSRTKENWIPAELCDIEPGNPYLEKLTDTQTAEMIKYACNRPSINGEAIVDRGLPKLGLSSNTTTPLNGFGVTVDNEMMVVPLRELPAPRIAYRSGQQSVANGSWNIVSVKFQRGCRVESWTVLVVRDSPRSRFTGGDDPALIGLVDGFAAKLRSSGVDMPQGRPALLPVNLLPPNFREDPTRSKSLQILRSAIQGHITSSRKKPSFILVLLENRDNFIYPGLKKIGDAELGVQTVCMQLGKALNEPRKQDQYFSNVALKVNTKLGGMNHLLEESAMKWLTKKKTMMVGIDVTHPGPGSKEGSPSIVAVVANVDDSFVQFPASLAIQRSKIEIDDQSSKLVDMLVERLLAYQKKSKDLPSRVFVYRDGVSEGQYDLVLKTELPQILAAFKKFETGPRKTYRPSLTIIICGKRHNAKFFSTDSAFADKNGNTRPGSVVDKGITGVFDFDFYLQAHAGLQGHAKATHYTVVYDENDLSADEIQQGTHTASYLYVRATKAVSLIPAAYYADLACERGRCYLNDFLVGHLRPSGGGKGKSKGDADAEAKAVFDAATKAWGQGLHADMKEVMFYI